MMRQILGLNLPFFDTRYAQAFSEDGVLLASVGQDDNHCLAVHDWQKGKLQHTGSSDSRAVRDGFDNFGAEHLCLHKPCCRIHN